MSKQGRREGREEAREGARNENSISTFATCFELRHEVLSEWRKISLRLSAGPNSEFKIVDAYHNLASSYEQNITFVYKVHRLPEGEQRTLPYSRVASSLPFYENCPIFFLHHPIHICYFPFSLLPSCPLWWSTDGDGEGCLHHVGCID